MFGLARGANTTLSAFWYIARMLRCAFCLLATIASFAAEPAKPLMTATDVEAFLDGLIPVQIEKDDIAGVVVSIVKDGKVLFAIAGAVVLPATCNSITSGRRSSGATQFRAPASPPPSNKCRRQARA